MARDRLPKLWYAQTRGVLIVLAATNRVDRRVEHDVRTVGVRKPLAEIDAPRGDR